MKHLTPYTSFFAIAALCAATISSTFAQDKRYGTDFHFGGEGNGQGKFKIIRDFCFDAKDNIYVLDGVSVDTKAKAITDGNGLVQIFDSGGIFSASFPSWTTRWLKRTSR